MSEYFDQLASTWEQNPMRIERASATAERVRKTSISSYRHLVDFGGGTGLLSCLLADEFERVTVVDTSQAMLKQAEQKALANSLSNINTSTALPSEPASALVSLMALHHVKDLEGFFSQASVCLEAAGTLMIADLYKEDGSFHHHEPGFDGHNGFDIEQLSKMLTQHHFTVEGESQYFSITKEDADGELRDYPLFFLVATKN